MRAHIFKMCFSNVFSSTDPSATKLGLIAHHHKLDWLVKNWIALWWSRSRSQKRFKTPVNVHLEDISSTAKPSVTKPAIVMHHHGPECCARRLVCCLQVQVYSEGSYNET